MSNTKAMFGWDLLFNSVASKVTKKDDVLMILVHWYVTKHGFSCIGVGSEKVFNSEDVGSESLPSGWNSSPDGNYALRYINDNILYVLCGTHTGDVLVLNLLRCSDYSVSSVTFKVDQTVKGLSGPLETIIPAYQNALSALKDQLLKPVFSGNSQEVHTQTTHSGGIEAQPRASPPTRDILPEPDPLRVGAPRRGLSTGFDPGWDPLNVGRSDLDPLGGGLGQGPAGGGMLFNPFGPGSREPYQPGAGNLPQGAIPPGARFDPFGPVGPGPGRPQRPTNFQPDPDHLPPPGYDDMFM